MGESSESRRHLEQGIRHQEAEQWVEAAAAFARALELEPDLLEAALRLGHCHEVLAELSRAVDAYRVATRIAPEHIEAATCLAESLRESGCLREALEGYDRVLALGGDHVFALAGKGEVLRLLGHPEEALVWFDGALQLHPQHTFSLRGKAAALSALRRFSEALPYWEDAIALDKGSAFSRRGKRTAEDELLRQLERVERGEPDPGPPPRPPPPAPGALEADRQLARARALLADQRTEEAVVTLERAMVADPDCLEAAIRLARSRDALERWTGASEAWEVARGLAPERAKVLVGRADTLRRAGRLSEALEAFDLALEHHPRHVGALVGRGETLRLLGRPVDALAWHQRALERAPVHAYALRGKAAALNALQRFEEALPIWQLAVDLDPGSTFSRTGQAHCKAELERASRRRTVPVDVDEDGPVRASARRHYDEARGLLQQRRLDEAIVAAERATKLDAEWLEPWRLLGELNTRAERLDRVVAAMDQVLDRSPGDVVAMQHKADALRRDLDLRRALEVYEQILSSHPDQVEALRGRAESHLGLGSFAEAIGDFERVLSAHPDDAVATHGRAAALTALRRFDEAADAWRRAAELEPGSTAAAEGLAHCQAEAGQAAPEGPVDEGARTAAHQALLDGRSAHRTGDLQLAIAAYQRALELDPTLIDAAKGLGLACDAEELYPQAIAAFELALQLDPDDVQAATGLGEVYRQRGDLQAALRAYDAALRIRSDHLHALAGRAEALRMLAYPERSLAWFDRALAINPEYVFAVQGKAAALNSLQRFDEALPLWSRALEVDPSSTFAEEGLAACRAETGETTEVDEDSPTPTLDEQGRDLTALARADELTQVVGRQREIRAVMKTLVRRNKANPLLLGDPGVGKTAVVEGVARLLASGEAPERLEQVRIVELAMGTLVAGTKYRGTFEDRLKAIIKEVRDNPGIVLFIDEIHTLVGAGRTEGGSLDAANILKPALARGEINVIGATTMAEYRKHLEPDSALERRFQPITIEEPSIEDTVHLLGVLQEQYAEHHDVTVDPAALRACVKLAVRFLTDRHLPDKALDLLDESCAEASLSGTGRVTVHTVAEVVAERTGIPARELTAAERHRMVRMEAYLGDRVIGQDDAIHSLASTVRLARAGLRDPRKPRGVLLFVGPTGVGKTELAKALADFLFPEGNALIRLDMSEYTDKFTGTRLVGAPPGYAGHGDEGQLTGKLRRRPYAVVLLDEFEKAHPDVQSMFLSLFDEGTLTDAEGRRIDAREALFIMTSNAGLETGSRTRVGFGPASQAFDREAVLSRIRPHFRPELLDRLDEVVCFRPLEPEVLRAIVELNLHHLEGRAAEQGVRLEWSAEVVELCASSRHEAGAGARPALRAIEELVAEPLGHLLLGEDAKGSVFRAVVEDGRVVFERVAAPQGVGGPVPSA